MYTVGIQSTLFDTCLYWVADWRRGANREVASLSFQRSWGNQRIKPIDKKKQGPKVGEDAFGSCHRKSSFKSRRLQFCWVAFSKVFQQFRGKFWGFDLFLACFEQFWAVMQLGAFQDKVFGSVQDGADKTCEWSMIPSVWDFSAPPALPDELSVNK